MCASPWKDAGLADGCMLARTLARELSYQAVMLYRDRPALDLEKIRSAFAGIRKFSTHGVRSYKDYKPLDIIRESKALEILSHEKYYELFTDGRHPPATADVEE